MSYHAVMPLCCVAVATLLSGCISTGTREITTDQHWSMTRITGFELQEDGVCLKYLNFSEPEPRSMPKLRVGETYETQGVNTVEQWTLNELTKGQAKFDVRGRYYSCVNPLARLGIPSELSHWTVVVREPQRESPAEHEEGPGTETKPLAAVPEEH